MLSMLHGLQQAGRAPETARVCACAGIASERATSSGLRSWALSLKAMPSLPRGARMLPSRLRRQRTRGQKPKNTKTENDDMIDVLVSAARGPLQDMNRRRPDPLGGAVDGPIVRPGMRRTAGSRVVWCGRRSLARACVLGAA